MSDDTPTERFPTPDGQGTEPLPAAPGAPEPAPTEVLRPAAAAAPASTAPAAYSSTSSTPPPATPGQSRGLLYALVGVGAALLIAIIIVVIMLLNRGDEAPVVTPSTSASPSASASPSPTPSESPSEEPEPVPEPAPPVVTGPTFDSFDAPQSAGCAEGDTSTPLTFTWSSSNASTAYIGVATTNAKSAPYEGGLPVVYTYTNLSYQCSEASQVYTVTLEDADGALAHQTVTITK